MESAWGDEYLRSFTDASDASRPGASKPLRTVAKLEEIETGDSHGSLTTKQDLGSCAKATISFLLMQKRRASGRMLPVNERQEASTCLGTLE